VTLNALGAADRALGAIAVPNSLLWRIVQLFSPLVVSALTPISVSLGIVLTMFDLQRLTDQAADDVHVVMLAGLVFDAIRQRPPVRSTQP
jgi:hypothetical protein